MVKLSVLCKQCYGSGIIDVGIPIYNGGCWECRRVGWYTVEWGGRWIINKKSRGVLYAYTPYSDGKACELANVPYGKIYDDFTEASIDAEKLSQFNPVGYRVLAYVDWETLR